MLSFVEKCRGWLGQSSMAMDYLEKERRLSRESIASAGIGYFPPGARIGCDSQTERELEGLKGRIIIPIFSEFGDLVGIAGRVPDKSVKGWWNTSFTKGSHLYGLNRAKQSVFKNNKAYVFEGYMDKITMEQVGMVNSVAAMGTDLGLRRIGLLARYCNRICLCFDTDLNSSGLLGMLKTLDELYSLGIGMEPTTWEISMVKLPVGVDPDDFVLDNGLDAFLGLETVISPEKMKIAGLAYKDLKWRIKGKMKKENCDGQ